MKRVVFFVLILILVISTAGCIDNKDQIQLPLNTPKVDENETTADEAEPVHETETVEPILFQNH